MGRQPARRPALPTTIRRLWRDPARLQVGTDPSRAVVLEFTDAAQPRLLDLLDGSHTEPGLLRAARQAGIPPADAEVLLRALTEAGYIVDSSDLELPSLPEPARRRLRTEAAAVALHRAHHGAPPPPRNGMHVMQRRYAAQVIVSGVSRLAVPIACLLAASGVGRVDADQSGLVRPGDTLPGGLLPADAHRPRGVAAADALRRVAPDLEVGRLRVSRATFVVVVGSAAPASLTALSYGSRRLAHLAVCVRDGTVVVGPLVRPGRSPCLNCLDLHRADHDPDWRAVAAQLQTTPDLAEPVTSATALAGVAFAAAEVLAYLDGDTPTTLGATIEIPEPGRTIRRQWTQHPSCGCRRRVRHRPRGTKRAPGVERGPSGT
jgi:bacteriocin biosynthesis cyclodehydratase domain-containing protein